MKIIFALLIAFIGGVNAVSQTTTTTPRVRTVSTSGNSQFLISDTARFEIVSIGESQPVVRLDRYTGRTHIFEYARARWYVLDVRGGLPNQSGNTVPKYQIYNEGAPILINNETGQSWFLNIRTWIPILD